MVNYDPKVISRVVIGEKMSQRYRELLLSLLRGHPVLDKVLVEEAYVDRKDFDIKTKVIKNNELVAEQGHQSNLACRLTLQ